MPDSVTYLAGLFRAELDSQATDAVQAMAAEWLKVEQRLEGDIYLLASELANPPGGVKLDPMAKTVLLMQQAGYKPEYISKLLASQGIFKTPDTAPQAPVKAWQLAKLQRYVRLLAQVQVEIEKYTGQVGEPVIQKLQNDAALAGLSHSLTLLDATISTAGGDVIDFTFDRLGIEAVENITAIARAGKPLGDLLQAAYPLGAAGITDELIAGTAIGQNPRVTARKMVAQGLSQSLNHMLLVARDQQIRAYREASRQQYAKSGIQQYRRLAAKQRRTCFPAGTKVLTGAGISYIEDIRPGDLVQTRHGLRAVTEIMNRSYRGCFVSLIHGDNQQLISTNDHPVWVENRQDWFEARNVYAGDSLLTPAGPSTVGLVSYWQAGETVYNLEVEEAHEYFAEGVLVHNCLACLALDGTIYDVAELMALHPEDRCLEPGQLVTTRRGFVPIEAVMPNDDVLTHTGRFRPVVAVSSRLYAGQLVRISYRGQSLVCTPEHRLLTGRGWVEARELRPDDTLAIPERTLTSRV